MRFQAMEVSTTRNPRENTGIGGSFTLRVGTHLKSREPLLLSDRSLTRLRCAAHTPFPTMSP